MLLSFVLTVLFVFLLLLLFIYYFFFRNSWCMSRFLISACVVGLDAGASGLGENVSVGGGEVE